MGSDRYAWTMLGLVGFVAVVAILTMTGIPSWITGGVTGFSVYWPTGENFPDNFAPPLDPISGEDYFNLKVENLSTGPLFTINITSDNKYLWYKGYYLNDEGNWRAFWFQHPDDGKWIKGKHVKQITNAATNRGDIPDEGYVLIFACERYEEGDPYICGAKDTGQGPFERYWTLHWYNVTTNAGSCITCSNEGEQHCSDGAIWRCVNSCLERIDECPFSSCNAAGTACGSSSGDQNLKVLGIVSGPNPNPGSGFLADTTFLYAELCKDVDSTVSGLAQLNVSSGRAGSEDTIVSQVQVKLNETLGLCNEPLEVFIKSQGTFFIGAPMKVVVNATFPSQYNSIATDDSAIWTLSGACIVPDSYCEDTQIVQCDGGAWGTPHDCPNAGETCIIDPETSKGICSVAGGGTTCDYGSCTGAGRTTCVDGTNYKTCGTDGCWSAPTSCGGSKFCAENYCWDGNCKADSTNTVCAVSGTTPLHATMLSGDQYCQFPWGSAIPITDWRCWDCSAGYKPDSTRSTCILDNIAPS